MKYEVHTEYRKSTEYPYSQLSSVSQLFSAGVNVTLRYVTLHRITSNQ